MRKVAPLRYDVIFKKAFGDLEIFTAFVKDVVGIDLDIDKVEMEKSFQRPVGHVKPRFDLFAEDVKNRVIVEIQHERYPDHYDKFLYYHCAALLEQIERSENYRPPLTVYTLVVLTSGDRFKKDIGVIDFDPHDPEGHPFGAISHKIFYICPKYATDKTPPAYREWLEAIEDSLDEQVDESHYHRTIIQKVFEKIDASRVSPEDKARMIEEFNQDALLKEKLMESEEKIKNEKANEIARNMLNDGEDKAKIAKFTGLTIDQINELSVE